jgi:hypothetical protein
MANTDVSLKDNKGVLVPNLVSVQVVAGDTITFSTVDGRAALAFFSPDAAAVLSPNPDNPCPIASGAKAHFSFTSSNRGAYSVYFGYGAGDAPDSFQGGHSEMLRLEVNAPDAPPFSGPTDAMGTGHGG